MSSRSYYKDLKPSNFTSDVEYLEERVKWGLQVGYTFQECFSHWIEDFGQRLQNASSQNQMKDNKWNKDPANHCLQNRIGSPQHDEDALILFMQKQFPSFMEIPHLTNVWCHKLSNYDVTMCAMYFWDLHSKEKHVSWPSWYYVVTIIVTSGLMCASSVQPQEFTENTSLTIRRSSPYCTSDPMKFRHCIWWKR